MLFRSPTFQQTLAHLPVLKFHRFEDVTQREPYAMQPWAFLFAARNSLKLHARVQVASFIADQSTVGRGGCSLRNCSKHMGILSYFLSVTCHIIMFIKYVLFHGKIGLVLKCTDL